MAFSTGCYEQYIQWLVSCSIFVLDASHLPELHKAEHNSLADVSARVVECRKEMRQHMMSTFLQTPLARLSSTQHDHSIANEFALASPGKFAEG